VFIHICTGAAVNDESPTSFRCMFSFTLTINSLTLPLFICNIPTYTHIYNISSVRFSLGPNQRSIGHVLCRCFHAAAQVAASTECIRDEAHPHAGKLALTHRFIAALAAFSKAALHEGTFCVS